MSALSEIAVIEDLSALAEEANREHAAVIADLASAVEHAFAVGAALNRAFPLIGEGDWHSWLANNFDGNESMTRLYRRMDLYRATLVANGITTVAAARAFLAEASLYLQPHRPGGGDYGGRRNLIQSRVLTAEEIAEIKALRKAGLTQRAIASICGVGKTTVERYTTAGYKAKAKAQEARARQRRKDQAAALRAQERLKAAKKAASDLSGFYARVRVLAQDLDRAIADCENKDVRAALKRGYQHLTQLEDSVGEALRLPS